MKAIMDTIVLFSLKHKNKVLLTLFLLFLTLPLWIKSNYVFHAINVALINVFPAVGLTILAGYTGQVSMCQATFFGIGAYLTVILGKHGIGFGLCVIAVPLCVALISCLLAAPALRLKGHYLVLLTIGFAEIMSVFAIQWRSITGGPDGLPGASAFKLLGIDLRLERNFFYFILCIVAVMLIVVSFYAKSQYGIKMKTVRQDPVAAEMIGINIRNQKLYSFIACGLLAGLGGAFYASYVGYISPELMSRSESIIILAMVTVGGMGNILGTAIGAFLVSSLPELLRVFKAYYYATFALIIVLTMIYMPRGLGNFVADKLRHVRQRAYRIKDVS